LAVSESQIFVGIALTFGLAVGSQILAARLGIPAIVVLLPVGFTAGALTDVINPNKIFGPAFSPMVSLAVAVILFDASPSAPSAELPKSRAELLEVRIESLHARPSSRARN
jgi:NhaP-type Na+/H+ or K+/H+ antiporter